MLRLRLKIIENVLKVTEPGLVKEAIYQILNEELMQTGPEFQISQFFQNIKSDILFQLMSKQNQREFKNLKEALSAIESYKKHCRRISQNYWGQ